MHIVNIFCLEKTSQQNNDAYFRICGCKKEVCLRNGPVGLKGAKWTSSRNFVDKNCRLQNCLTLFFKTVSENSEDWNKLFVWKRIFSLLQIKKKKVSSPHLSKRRIMWTVDCNDVGEFFLSFFNFIILSVLNEYHTGQERKHSKINFLNLFQPVVHCVYLFIFYNVP